MKKMMGVLAMILLATLTLCDDATPTNVIPVHLGGFVQDIDPPDISFSNATWSVNDVDTTTSIFNTTMNLRCDDEHVNVPVKLAMQVTGYLGNYAITLHTNGQVQNITDARLPVDLSNLGGFNATTTGSDYPLEIDYTDNTTVIEKVHGDIQFYAYYQS